MLQFVMLSHDSNTQSSIRLLTNHPSTVRHTHLCIICHAHLYIICHAHLCIEIVRQPSNELAFDWLLPREQREVV